MLKNFNIKFSSMEAAGMENFVTLQFEKVGSVCDL